MSIHWGGRGAGHISRLSTATTGVPALALNFLSGALDPRITFTRSSNATLVDATGRITYAPANLLLQSENFATTWTGPPTTGTLTANATTSPTGTSNATLFVPSNTAVNHDITQNVTASAITYTLSVYAKAQLYNHLFLLYFDGTVDRSAYFNVGTGSIGTTSGSPSPTITAVGNGWYRCSITVTGVVGRNNFVVGAAPSDGGRALAGNGTSGIFLWGAQLEPVTYQTTPSTYVATTTTAYYGPRFDYDPVTLASKGLLIEGARTNILLYSEQLDNAAWTKVGMTVTANAGVSPNGTTTAGRVVYNGAGVASVSTTQNAVANVPGSNQTITVSIWLKSFSGSNQSLRLKNTHGGVLDNFSSNLTITNQWQRFTFTVTNGAGVGTSQILGLSPETGNAAFDVLAWGAQMEIGALATSYIPTVASTVPRGAELASMTGTNFTSWFNATQGTFVSSFDVIGNLTATSKRFVWNGSDAGNQRLALRALAPSVNFPIAAIGTGVGVASLNGTTLTVDTITKLAVAYGSSLALSQNGAIPVTDASASSVLVTSFDIGCGISANQLNGHMRSLIYYNTRLPNTSLQTLTV